MVLVIVVVVVSVLVAVNNNQTLVATIMIYALGGLAGIQNHI